MAVGAGGGGAYPDTFRHTEFVDAVRLRLHAPVLTEGAECGRCGQAVDANGMHCVRCAPGPSTRGHNCLRDVCLGLANLSDPRAATEVRGLIPSAPQLRPADLLTTAAFGRCCALDLGVCCPDVAGAGVDACAAMAARKEAERPPIME